MSESDQRVPLPFEKVAQNPGRRKRSEKTHFSISQTFSFIVLHSETKKAHRPIAKHRIAILLVLASYSFNHVVGRDDDGAFSKRYELGVQNGLLAGTCQEIPLFIRSSTEIFL